MNGSEMRWCERAANLRSTRWGGTGRPLRPFRRSAKSHDPEVCAVLLGLVSEVQPEAGSFWCLSARYQYYWWLMPETHMRKPLALALSCAVASPFAHAHETIESPKGPIIIESVASGLEHPWALGFLPDGRMLVTERPGRIRVVTRSGEISPSGRGVPPVHVEKDSGLLDLALDREFPSNHTLYFCFAEAVGDGGRTTVARARFIDGEVQELVDVRVIFRQEGPISNGNHYGCRIAQSGDGTLFVTLGDNGH